MTDASAGRNSLVLGVMSIRRAIYRALNGSYVAELYTCAIHDFLNGRSRFMGLPPIRGARPIVSVSHPPHGGSFRPGTRFIRAAQPHTMLEVVNGKVVERAVDPPNAKFDYVTGVYQGGVKIA